MAHRYHTSAPSEKHALAATRAHEPPTLSRIPITVTTMSTKQSYSPQWTVPL